jgi:uncharacterized protein YyaL (SSP411 family)
VAEEIISHVLRDMTFTEGGFLSAEDADSEGIELNQQMLSRFWDEQNGGLYMAKELKPLRRKIICMSF